MTKHVFELTQFGSFWHQGQLIGETDKTYKVLRGQRKGRVNKSERVKVIETDDVKETSRLWDEAAKPYDAAIRVFRDDIANTEALKIDRCWEAVGAKS